MRGLVVGRFQPFHNGHAALVKAAFGRCTHVVVGLGSSNAKAGLRNPFTTAERRSMVEAAFPKETASGALVTVDIPDLHDPPRYARHALALAGQVEVVFGNDDSTLELFEREGLRIERPGVVERERYEASSIRAQLAADDGAWRKCVPPAVAALLVQWDAGKRLRGLEAYA